LLLLSDRKILNVTPSIFPDIQSRDTTLTTQTGENDEIVSESSDTRAHDSSVTDTIVELYFYCETRCIFSLMIAGYDVIDYSMEES
jgi:hypothetical protein